MSKNELNMICDLETGICKPSNETAATTHDDSKSTKKVSLYSIIDLKNSGHKVAESKNEH